MRIKSIEYENFRNFKDAGKIECSTDGKVTIIYGRNGDGKTTLHQLFQWIFFGQVHFNKTTTNKLYNLQFEKDQKNGSSFSVNGRINFIHAGVEYTVRRTAYYGKDNLGITSFDHEDFELQKKDEKNDWIHVNNPVEAIEQLLPIGLSEYFFFDGENMIADLSTTGDESAEKLKAALYSIFDLDILDMAVDHIGDTKLKKTVLGKLYLAKGEGTNDSDISIIRMNIENAQSKIESLTKKLAESKQKKEEAENLIKTISEKIGSTKSKAEYEKQRKILQTKEGTARKNLELNEQHFGEAVIDTYPKLLISRAILDASDILKLKINKSSLPIGLGKTLIKYLLSKENENGTCICGNPLCDKERDHIRAFLDMLPPKSYTNIYQEFIITAKNWGKGEDREELEGYIKSAIADENDIQDSEEQIRILDTEQKKSPDIEQLVTDRQKAEITLKQLDELIVNVEMELKKANLYLKKQMQEYDKLAKDDAKAQEVQNKIDIMEAVKEAFQERLTDASETYSQKLQDNIQTMLDSMMDNERKVSVSSQFEVRVYDSFGDESKSEGQFAITSFAYIGGIFRMLRSDERLKGKEYPLVLDGPFSKLDPKKINNVVEVIPQFAPQVILFSKDSLQQVFKPDKIGRVWTIVSNVEQNVASVKEGYLWK